MATSESAPISENIFALVQDAGYRMLPHFVYFFLFLILFYTFAGEALQAIMLQRSRGLCSPYQLKNYDTLAKLSEFVEVIPDDSYIYHLYEKNTPLVTPIEATFEIQGYILDYRLPIFQKCNR